MFRRSIVSVSGFVRNSRCFRSNAALRDVKQTAPTTTPASTTSKIADSEQVIGTRMHRNSNFDKSMLVWMKKFKSKDEVPDKVPVDLYHKVQSQARVRVANIMIVMTIIGCIGAVISGKRDAKSGKTLAQQNTDWHNKINAEYKASQAAEAAAKAS